MKFMKRDKVKQSAIARANLHRHDDSFNRKASSRFFSMGGSSGSSDRFSPSNFHTDEGMEEPFDEEAIRLSSCVPVAKLEEGVATGEEAAGVAPLLQSGVRAAIKGEGAGHGTCVCACVQHVCQHMCDTGHGCVNGLKLKAEWH